MRTVVVVGSNSFSVMHSLPGHFIFYRIYLWRFWDEQVTCPTVPCSAKYSTCFNFSTCQNIRAPHKSIMVSPKHTYFIYWKYCTKVKTTKPLLHFFASKIIKTHYRRHVFIYVVILIIAQSRLLRFLSSLAVSTSRCLRSRVRCDVRGPSML